MYPRPYFHPPIGSDAPPIKPAPTAPPPGAVTGAPPTTPATPKELSTAAPSVHPAKPTIPKVASITKAAWIAHHRSGDATGVPSTRRAMPWGRCMGVLPG